MAYRVAIVDDSKTDAEFVRGILNGWADQRQADIRAEAFPSAEAFLFRYAEDKDWDILLLDIEMGDIDGVTMAKKVRQDNEAVQIVFITGYSEYIAEGYEVAALHYLMKPVNREKLMAVLDRALEKRKQEERCLNLEAYGEMVRIPFYEIRFLDVHQNYVTVHAKADYTVKRTLGDFEKELDDRFCRVGRAMILNLKYIRRVTKTEVCLSDGTALPLPRGAYEPLNRAIIQHT
ncbi:MAG: LytTR family DNA-binding domain-containing protein [Fusicatenibacter sp.]|nr:LytTR family DNA-binding domain-containing protein [Lachnospiraceae bacterium]MDY2937266.1 LytTR family DNA-binding domain-containing protein [Fusicatenibacter sp.]